MSLLMELWRFMRARKKYWLLPILLVMFLLGGFLTGAMKPENAKDIDFFPFPMINPKWGQDSIDAPIDGYMISKKPKNLDGAKKLGGGCFSTVIVFILLWWLLGHFRIFQ